MPAPYNYNTVPINPVGAFEAGVQARQAQLANQQGLQQNAMKLAAEQSATQAQQAWDAAVAKGDLQTANRIDPTHTQRYLGNLSQLNSEQRKQAAFAATQRFHMAAMAANSPNPVESMNRMIQANPRLFPLAQNGVQTPADVQHVLAEAKYGAMTADQYAQQEQQQVHTLTPAELKQAGLQDGTVAQRYPTGAIKVVQKPGGLYGQTQVIGDPKLSGDAYLQSIDPNDRQTVLAAMQGRMRPPSGTVLKSPYWQGIMNAVRHLDPSFDEVTWQRRYKTAGSYAPGGTQGDQVIALNTLINHVNELHEQYQSLDNSGSPAWNRVANFFEEETGAGKAGKALPAYRANAQAVAQEIEKLWRKGGGSEADIQGYLKSLRSSNSPEQEKQAIDKVLRLAYGRLIAMKKTYENAMGSSATGMNFVNRNSQHIIGQLAPDLQQEFSSGANSAPSGVLAHGQPIQAPEAHSDVSDLLQKYGVNNGNP